MVIFSSDAIAIIAQRAKDERLAVWLINWAEPT
jgi:hypothetical protein